MNCDVCEQVMMRNIITQNDEEYSKCNLCTQKYLEIESIQNDKINNDKFHEAVFRERYWVVYDENYTSFHRYYFINYFDAERAKRILSKQESLHRMEWTIEQFNIIRFKDFTEKINETMNKGS